MHRLVLEPSGRSHFRPELTTQLERAVPDRAAVVTLADSGSGQLRAAADVLARADDDVLIVAGDVVVPDSVLFDAARRARSDPARVAGLVRSGPAEHPVATSGATVVAAATALHRLDGPDADAVGVMVVPAALVHVASAALRAEIPADGSWDRLDAFELALAALVRGGVDVAAIGIDPFPGARASTPAAATEITEQIAGIDEARLAARRSSRGDDGFYSTFALRRLSRPVSRWGAEHGVSANAVTLLSGVIGVLAAVLFGTGAYLGLLAGAVLLQAALVLDCVDGEIARATGTFSPFGAWLDASLDRVKEYAALAGLAAGAGRHGTDVWLLALAGMVVQTARHVEDFGFDKGVLALWRTPQVDRRPLSDRTPWVRAAGSAAPAGGAPSASGWVRRVVHMPIAERWLVLSLGAALGRPMWSLLGYLALTSLAAAWTLLGALRRSLRSTAGYPTGLRTVLARYRDDGVLRLVLRDRGPAGTAGWLLPVTVTALEGTVLVLAAVSGGYQTRAWTFAWFAAVAWHRYDLIYRWRDRALAVPAWAQLAGGGWAVRSAVVVVVGILGARPLGLGLGAVWLTLVFVPESMRAGTRSWQGALMRSGAR